MNQAATDRAASPLRLRTHSNYDRLVALAAESHARGRDPFAATPRDIIARIDAEKDMVLIKLFSNQLGSLEFFFTRHGEATI